MNDKEMLFKFLRMLINYKDIKYTCYSPYTVRSMLYGQRINDLMLQILIDIALKNIEIMKSEIIKHKEYDCDFFDSSMFYDELSIYKLKKRNKNAK